MTHPVGGTVRRRKKGDQGTEGGEVILRRVKKSSGDLTSKTRTGEEEGSFMC